MATATATAMAAQNKSCERERSKSQRAAQQMSEKREGEGRARERESQSKSGKCPLCHVITNISHHSTCITQFPLNSLSIPSQFPLNPHSAHAIPSQSAILSSHSCCPRRLRKHCTKIRFSCRCWTCSNAVWMPGWLADQPGV